MVGVEPGEFLAVEELWLDEREINGRQRDRLEAERLALGARDLPRLDNDQILEF